MQSAAARRFHIRAQRHDPQNAFNSRDLSRAGWSARAPFMWTPLQLRKIERWACHKILTCPYSALLPELSRNI
jgi:hypothetical protein